MSRTNLSIVLAVLVEACATTLPAGPVAPEPAAPVTVAQPFVPPSVAQEPEAPAPPNPADVARARALVKRGELLYRNGEYDQAEAVLKESVTLYPFLAQANLLLGKIFLIRGSAGRDVSLIHSARLMFEMAHALDSSLREAEILLDLFLAPPLE
jgi:tetratricopeptide (TPR) repeat protein